MSSARVPWWAWLTSLVGFLGLMVGDIAIDDDDDYREAVWIEVAAALTLAAPLVLVGRGIEQRLEDRQDENSVAVADVVAAEVEAIGASVSAGSATASATALDATVDTGEVVTLAEVEQLLRDADFLRMKIGQRHDLWVDGRGRRRVMLPKGDFSVHRAFYSRLKRSLETGELPYG